MALCCRRNVCLSWVGGASSASPPLPAHQNIHHHHNHQHLLHHNNHHNLQPDSRAHPRCSGRSCRGPRLPAGTRQTPPDRTVRFSPSDKLTIEMLEMDGWMVGWRLGCLDGDPPDKSMLRLFALSLPLLFYCSPAGRRSGLR